MAILGIDEVGRGCWAGPLVVGAVVLGGAEIDGLTDSKALSKKRREELSAEIYEKANGIGLGWVGSDEIDEIGLGPALRLATKRAVQAIRAPFHEIILDGTINFLSDTPLERHVTTMKKADLLVPSVSAASIVAKVARDQYMTEQAMIYPEYQFAAHVGYGTAVHRQAIEMHGVTPLHRLSIAPLQKYRVVAESDAVPKSPDSLKQSKTTRQIGDASEIAAAEELARRGHDIIERNWKTRYCEIDIISRVGDTLYFTEVKHRRNNKAGDGLSAITAKKLAQMNYAARFYVHTNHLEGLNLHLMAVSTAGDTPGVVAVVEIDG